jgi:hypothetical protein
MILQDNINLADKVFKIQTLIMLRLKELVG